MAARRCAAGYVAPAVGLGLGALGASAVILILFVASNPSSGDTHTRHLLAALRARTQMQVQTHARGVDGPLAPRRSQHTSVHASVSPAMAARGMRPRIAPPAPTAGKASGMYTFDGIRMEPVIKGLRSPAVVNALRDPEVQKWVNPSKSLKFVVTESLDQPLFGNAKVLNWCHRKMDAQCKAKQTSEMSELQDLASLACSSALQDVREKAAARVPLAHRSRESRVSVMAEKTDDSDIRQLLGVKGGSRTDNLWKIRLQLMKPVTWVPLIWGVICGAAASGNYHAVWSGAPIEVCLEDLGKSIGCMILAGPLLTGYTQTINDWYDRDIDAINEPDRPIPSGAIKEGEVIAQIWALLLSGLGLAYGLDQWAGHDFPMVTALSVGGSFVSYIYSAPPLKLKQSGWAGNYALGSSYIALPWWCGQAMFGTLNAPVVVLSLLYSIAGLGIAIVNDFKSIEGDRQLGLQSLPVAFGVEKAKWLCAGSIDLTQLGVAAYLFSIGETTYATILLGLIAPQIFLQNKYLLKDPIKYDVQYQAAAQPFLVFGILNTALAVGHHQF